MKTKITRTTSSVSDSDPLSGRPPGSGQKKSVPVPQIISEKDRIEKIPVSILLLTFNFFRSALKFCS